MMLTNDQIYQLSTPRLLNYYKKKRQEQYRYICGCCHEFIWNLGDGDEEIYLADYNELMSHLIRLKAELNLREHIPNKK